MYVGEKYSKYLESYARMRAKNWATDSSTQFLQLVGKKFLKWKNKDKDNKDKKRIIFGNLFAVFYDLVI